MHRRVFFAGIPLPLRVCVEVDDIDVNDGMGRRVLRPRQWGSYEGRMLASAEGETANGPSRQEDSSWLDIVAQAILHVRWNPNCMWSR
jgi:hypothetical protein